MRGPIAFLGCILCTTGCTSRNPIGAAKSPGDQPPSAAAHENASRPSSSGALSANSVAHVLGLPPLPDQLKLPILTNRSALQSLDQGLETYVSSVGAYVGREQLRVAVLGPQSASEGYAFSDKNLPNDLTVLPLLNALRSRTESRESDVKLFADEQTPYRVLVETLNTLEQAGFVGLSLLAIFQNPASVSV